jgi:hypothetical protein
MRKEKALITMLNGLVKLLSEEAARNPEFADKLESLLSPLQPERATPRASNKPDQIDLPDVYAEFTARGEGEFRLWLRDQPVPVLYAVIRRHDLDATRRSSKWKDPEKLSGFIADQIRSRLSRGSSFLSGGEGPTTEDPPEQKTPSEK